MGYCVAPQTLITLSHTHQLASVFICIFFRSLQRFSFTRLNRRTAYIIVKMSMTLALKRLSAASDRSLVTHFFFLAFETFIIGWCLYFIQRDLTVLKIARGFIGWWLIGLYWLRSTVDIQVDWFKMAAKLWVDWSIAKTNDSFAV